MLRGGDVKEVYEMHGRGHSSRAIARGLGLARNTVLRYLNSPEVMVPKPRPPGVEGQGIAPSFRNTSASFSTPSQISVSEGRAKHSRM